MVHNDGTPTIEVDAQTYEVRADGELRPVNLPKFCRWLNATFFLMVEIKHKLKIVRGAYKIEIKGQLELPFEMRQKSRFKAQLASGEEVGDAAARRDPARRRPGDDV